MGVKWTKEQQDVIDTHHCNLLVSAAAGSGKTAVLVARILAMITDPVHPVDIDRLLVVTFTNAAASEMRQRIRDALAQRAEEEPENEHLQRQLVLIHNAKITTIHSFCLQVLRSHFQLAGIDPAFRVADEGEMLLLKQDVLKETLEEAYQKATSWSSPDAGEDPQQGSEADAGDGLRQGSEADAGDGLQQGSEADVRDGLQQGGTTDAGDASWEEDRSYAQDGSQDASVTGAEDTEFTQFLEQFATGKDDRAVEEAVLALYHFSLGQPWPEDWLRECRSAYAPEAWPDSDSNAGAEPAWMQRIVDDAHRILEDVQTQLQEAIRIAGEPDGPYPYLKALQDDWTMLEPLLAADNYRALADAFFRMGTYTRLGAKKDVSISEEKKQKVKELRDRAKEDVALIRQQYFYDDPEVIRREYLASRGIVHVLTRLTSRFSEKLAQKKAEKNVLDFSDLEHLALQVLVEKNDGRPAPSAAAKEYAEQFEEIMIDEYQDSNLVQEILLSAVSGRGTGEPNRFMVGDVKQSIYRFRLARPELFMQKYETYQMLQEGAEPAPPGTRICLHKNFRSRSQVLGSVNYLFWQIMTKSLGGIAYDRDAALYAGAKFPERPETVRYMGAKLPEQTDTRQACGSSDAARTGTGQSELPCATRTGTGQSELSCAARTGTEQSELSCAVRTGEEKQGADNTDFSVEKRHGSLENTGNVTELLLLDPGDEDKIEAEARLAGIRIHQLISSGFQVYDAKAVQEDGTAGGYRPVQYRDIVILLRTVSGWAETFGRVLADMGIPCFTGSQTGYFAAAEVRVILAYLEILDNPVQDIPLAAALRSPIGGFSDEELAQVRSEGGSGYFYDCCMTYRECGKDDRIRAKLAVFFRVLGEFRRKAAYTPVHLLIWEILDVTGYGEYASALPAGGQRRANLDMLVEKAIAYEATSYRGLYQFVRYIENLRRYEVDFGEANIGTESDNTVRLMSIHKSKGLEFPVVFVSGMGKQFNEMDLRSKAVLHPELGIGCDYVDTELRLRSPNLLKRVIQRTTRQENLGEELRVLYVAMTRAKEKLILTGSAQNAAEKLAKWNTAAQAQTARLPYSRLSSASSYLDWVMPSALRHPDARTLAEDADLAWQPFQASQLQTAQAEGVDEAFDARFEMRLVRMGDLENADWQAAQPAAGWLEKLLAEVLDGGQLKSDWMAGSDVGLLRQESSDNTDRKKLHRSRIYSIDMSRPVHEQPAGTDAGETERVPAGLYPAGLDAELLSELQGIFTAEYPHLADEELPGKLSVSELKRASQQPEEPEAVELYKSEQAEPLVPRFMEGEQIRSGAARGTLYHIFMENLDYSKKQNLEMQLEELQKCGKMTRDEAASIRLSDIRRFLDSDIGRRMEQAALAGRLYREQPFVLGIPASEVRQEWGSQETVLIQGIIDAWFREENGDIVVVDYKTDRVSEMETLVEKYHVQLEYYARALHTITKRRVQSAVIYSFRLHAAAEVSLPE